MNKRIGLVIAGVAAAAVMAGGTAFATSSSPSTTASTIYGCYDSGGNLKVGLPLGTTACPKGYTALDWNQTGPPGQNGTDGTNGTNGTDGTNGANGTNFVTSVGVPTGACSAGDTDVDLATGEVYTCGVPGGAGGGKLPAWSDNGSSIMGPAGTNGTNGTSLATSAGEPTAACNVGDTDIDLATGEVYTCSTEPGYDTGVNGIGGGGGTAGPVIGWVDSGSTVKGPQGSQGPAWTPPNLVWTYTCATTSCVLTAADTIPVGAVITPISITEAGATCPAGTTDYGFAEIRDSQISGDPIAIDFYGNVPAGSQTTLGGPVTVGAGEGGPLSLKMESLSTSGEGDVCSGPVTVTFTFSESQQIYG
jgi:hypothetical protein